MNVNAIALEGTTILKKGSIPNAVVRRDVTTSSNVSMAENAKSAGTKASGILRTALTMLVLTIIAASITAIGPCVQPAHASALKAAALAVSRIDTPANGEYCIGIYGTSKVLDVQGASLADKGNVWIYDYNDTSAQRFAITKVDGNWYQIVNRNSGKALSVANGKKENGTNIWQYKNNKAKSQQWRFRNVGGYEVIESRLGGYVLNVDGSISKASSNVVLRKYSGSNAQKWTLVKKNDQAVKIDKGTIQLASALDGSKVIDVSGGNLENGANVQIWTNTVNTAQKITLSPASGYYYTLTFGVSNKVMDVKGASKAENANVQQYASNKSDAQMWRFIPCGNGYYLVQSKLGKFLTLANGSASSGTNVCMRSLQTKNPSCQMWKIVGTSLGRNTYYNKMINFIKNPNWKSGIGWGYYQTPKLNPNASVIGCAAYCYDWVKYMYGHNGLTTGAKKYTTANDIKTGCIVHYYYSYYNKKQNKTINTQHWFVVVSRSGNTIHSIEGNASSMTRDSTTVYKIKDGVLYSNSQAISNQSLYVYNHGAHYNME